MRRIVALLVVSVFSGCAATRPSRWEPREPRPGDRIQCDCAGVERGPKPSEASSDSDETVVLAVCEGKVSNCRPLRSRGPYGNTLD